MKYLDFFDINYALAFAFAFLVFAIIFLLSNISSGKIKITLSLISFLAFLGIPFLSIFIVNNYFFKTKWSNEGSKKLSYIDNYLITGKLENKGKKKINKCDVVVYESLIFSGFLKNPIYKIEISNLNLEPNKEIKINESISNFKEERAKNIGFFCS